MLEQFGPREVVDYSALAEQHGFTLRDHSMTLYGECNGPDCTGQKKQKPVTR